MPKGSGDVCGGATQTVISVEQVLDNLPDGITVQDREFTVLFQNRAMREAFGNQVGMKCYAAYERRANTCEGCGVARAFASGKPVLVMRTAFDATGKTSYWENACFPLFDSEGRIVAGAEVCRNVTDRVSLEAEVKDRNIELGQANRQLKEQTASLTETLRRLERETAQRERAEIELRQAQKLQAVGQLAAGIAHEINTPAQFIGDSLHFLAESFRAQLELTIKYQDVLRTLIGTPGLDRVVQALKEAEEVADHSYVKENAPTAFDRALDGIARISTIVRAMKEFAHPDQREKSPADLNRALETTLTIARSEYKDVAEVETDFGEIPQVLCHLGDLNQVFLNLLVNATHAIADAVGTSGSKGRIRVSSRREDRAVRIEISDTGCGIPEGIRDRIFEPFFTTKEVGRGTGQGLAIARSVVVERHGGSLTFESEVGKGTTFTVVLPIDGITGVTEGGLPSPHVRMG
jgi:signal transduction histidine kinase